MRKYKFQSGLIKTIKEADDGRGYFSTTWVQVNYDKTTGEVWGDWCVGNEWHEYHDPNVISIGKFVGKVTRSEIISNIEDEIALREYMCKVPVYAQPNI